MSIWNYSKTHTDNTEESSIENLKNDRVTVLDATLYVAVVTAIVYMWAYFRELGYKDYYNIPNMFIEMSTSSVIKAFGDTWTYLSVALIQCILGYFAFQSQVKWVGGIYLLFFYFLTRSIFVSEALEGIIFFLFTCVAISLLLSKTRLVKFLYYAFLICAIMIYSYGIGQFQAGNEDEYFLMTKTKTNVVTSTNYVVLDSYKNYFIIAPIDIGQKKITPSFELIEQKEIAQRGIALQYVNIGPLEIDSDSDIYTTIPTNLSEVEMREETR